MYCPHCGQERTSVETSFCSRCGFPLAGVAELIANGGMTHSIESAGTSQSPRTRGLKQGLFIFLLTFLIVPIVGIISISLNIQPWAVGISAVALIFGGLLRMLYALLFESSKLAEGQISYFAAPGPAFLNRQGAPGALPPQQSIPVTVYAPPAGKWRETKDLEPGSVTEHTTKLLEKEDQ